jgi:hypothetical protein
MRQNGDFVFDFELLTLKFGDPDIVRMGPGFFFGDQLIEVGMLGFESFDMFRRGHAATSLPGQRAVDGLDASAARPAL